MKEKHEPHHREQTSTTVNIKAGYWPYSCGFFCQRLTDNDVIDPKESSKEKSIPSVKQE